MIKLVIIDDDALVRFGLKTMIDWENHGYNLVGEAENGLQGFSVYMETKPDLILCDIKMPKMDGLELIKRIRLQDSAVKIVVLSYYCDLDTVKEAIKSGANEYYLKTSINENDLLDKLNNLTRESNLNPSIPHRANANKTNTIKKLLKTDASCTYAPESSDLSELNIFEKELYIVSGSVDHYKELSKDFNDDDKKLFVRTIKNIIDETVKNCRGYETAYISENSFVLLLNLASGKSEFLAHHDLYNLLKMIQHNCKLFSDHTISLGASSQINSYSQASEAYRQSLEALKLKFFHRDDNIFFYSSTKEWKHLNSELLEELSTEIRTAFLKTDLSALFECLDRMKNMFSEQNYVIRDMVFFVQSAQSLMIKELLKRQPDILISSVYKEDVNEKENIHDLFQVLIDCMKNIETNYLQQNKCSLIINKAVRYLENSCSNPELSQKDVSEFLNISTTYLSALFKKELNINFSDYLTGIRIEKACKLLKESDLKILEVSEAVGFANSSYFVKTFKKIKGVSPREYREACLSKRMIDARLR